MPKRAAVSRFYKEQNTLYVASSLQCNEEYTMYVRVSIVNSVFGCLTFFKIYIYCGVGCLRFHAFRQYNINCVVVIASFVVSCFVFEACSVFELCLKIILASVILHYIYILSKLIIRYCLLSVSRFVHIIRR